MPHLTPIHYAKFVKFLVKIGCNFKRQQGSHLIFYKEGLKRPIVVPAHKKPLSRKVVINNLKTLNISKERYLEIISDL